MTRPGVQVLSRATPPPRGIPADTGTWFAVGFADEGPAGVATLLQNHGDFIRIFGPRVSYAFGYDAVETYFRNHGNRMYFVRLAGPAATKATVSLVDRAVSPLPTLAVDAIGPGTYGATISVAVIAGSSGTLFKLQITRGGAVVETSPDLATPTDAVAWALGSNYVRVRDLASATVAPNNNPALAAATPLVGGADDRGSVTDTVKVAALANFRSALGPGQVSILGATTTVCHAGLRAHARANNRVAVCDAPDTSTVSTLTALLTGVDDEYGSIFAPWVTIPGLVPNTVRTIPPSAAAAAMMAKTDAVAGPNQPAAGQFGLLDWASGVTQQFLDVDRETLNTAGINVIRQVGADVRVYGFRTNANPLTNPAWIGLANQRLRMAITSDANVIGEAFEFDQIDGRGRLFSQFQGALAGMLVGYYNQGALYGDTPDAAYSVDTGPSVNTPTTIANNELHAIISARMSPFAELTVIEIVKVGVTQSV